MYVAAGSSGWRRSGLRGVFAGLRRTLGAPEVGMQRWFKWIRTVSRTTVDEGIRRWRDTSGKGNGETKKDQGGEGMGFSRGAAVCLGFAQAIAGVFGVAGASVAQTGTVLAEQKIDNGELTGNPLEALDNFGQSVASLGDLDGDSITDFAVGSPMTSKGVGQEGAVYILFMNADGTVKSHVVIEEGANGFVGPTGTDQFGWSVAFVGDLTSMGNPGDVEIAVGARVAGGGTGKGAVWLLSLSPAGLVTDEELIDDTDLTGTINNGDTFGSAVAGLGDLDGDGIEDIAVGAAGDNAGAVDAGAIWILQLNNDGTVKAEQKISNSDGAFGGTLAAFDSFGSSIASLGNLDGLAGGDVAVGAPGDDTPVSGGGAVWILFLNTNGTVVSEVEINSSDLTVALDPDDNFGAAVGNLGDLDVNGSVDIGVGAIGDDDGLLGAGAMYVLFLNSSGSVIGDDKISATEGGFGGLINGGQFGSGITSLGDLDGDGRKELAVGEAAAFGGGSLTSSGAVWVLSLVKADDVVWTGSQSTDWFTAANWSTNAVPDSTKGVVVRSEPNLPLVGANATPAEALDVFVGTGASIGLTVQDLEVSRNANLDGSVSGTGTLRFVDGDGSLVSTVTISAPVEVSTDLSTDVMEMRGSTITMFGDLTHLEGELHIDDGNTTTVVGTTTMSGGTLTGVNGTLDMDGPGTFNGTDYILTPPDIDSAGNLSIDADFDPDSNLVSMNGGPGQTLTATTLSNFSDLEIATPSVVTTAEPVQVDDDLNVQGSFNITSASISPAAATVGGNTTGGSTSFFQTVGPSNFQGEINFSGMMCPQGGLIIGTGAASNQTVAITQTLMAQLIINPGVGGLVTLLSPLTVEGGVIVQSGEFDIGGTRLEMPDDQQLTVMNTGKLSVGAGGEVALSTNLFTINSGGTLNLAGAATDRANIEGVMPTGGGAVGGYSVLAQAGSTVEAFNFRIQEMSVAGMVIDVGANIGAAPKDLRNGIFDRVADGGVLLEIERAAPTEFRYLRFADSLMTGRNATPGTTFNVRVPNSSSTITMTNWSGPFGGPTYEDDPGGVLDWGPSESTVLTFFKAKSRIVDVEFKWKTSAEVDIDRFVLERAPLNGSSFTVIVEVPPAGPQLYTYVDDTITPGSSYHWRFSERLTHGAVNVLGEAWTTAQGAPRFRPGPAVVPPLTPLTAGVADVSGGGDAIQHALDGLRGPQVRSGVTLRIHEGTYDAFSIPAWLDGAVRLVAAEPGAVTIDASAQPVVIEGLGVEASVELKDLVVRGSGGPLLVVRESEATVLLDRVRMEGGFHGPALLASAAAGVLLQRVEVSGPVGLHAEGASSLAAFGGRLGAVRALEGSSFTGFGVRAEASASGGATAVVHPAHPAILRDAGGGLRLDAAPGRLWRLFASSSLRLGGGGEARGQWSWFLGDRHPLTFGPWRELSDTVQMPADLRDGSGVLYLQALVYDPERGSFVLSTVESVHGEP